MSSGELKSLAVFGIRFTHTHTLVLTVKKAYVIYSAMHI